MEAIERGAPEPRELAARQCDGLHVVLLWDPRRNLVSVTVDDARVGERFELPVAPDCALDAFYHPFAYAA